ncbi:hypothetical protein [Streptomyces sp. Ru87]|uniref:hypothetical protein n=1 Tax=Streptomyces sp. Ru87 TaxID=2044307 RepID=UPI000BF649FE|nr:hypothetical protein [Streptomyces sp. Ru87]PGH46939.1 hypothetical protein CRI70_31320 [Streptomyces sp. Ru87]
MTETTRLHGLLHELWSGDWKPAAARAGEVMHEEMVRLGVWETVVPADRAAVRWAVATGRTITEQRVDTMRIKRGLSGLVDLLQHVIRVCERAPYPTARTVELRQAAETYRRLAALPEGWREEVVRRVMMGGEDMPHAVAEAQMSRNRLRSWYGPEAVEDTPVTGAGVWPETAEGREAAS